jgi:hypothetical protein
MSRDPSPYEILGLRPGASREAIEAAYRQRIKQHHPDVGGGDGEAARAIINAYRTLKRGEPRDAVIVAAPVQGRQRRRPWAALALAIAALAALWWAPWPTVGSAGLPAPAGEPRAMAVPTLSPSLLARVDPDAAAVEAGVEEAQRLSRQSPGLLAHYGKACAVDLDRLPGDAMLDHCLGFEMAASRSGAGPGVRGDERLAARHLKAAVRVLEDPVLAAARVRKIRKLVERKLLAGNEPALTR